MFSSGLQFGTFFNICCIGAGALMVFVAFLQKLSFV